MAFTSNPIYSPLPLAIASGGTGASLTFSNTGGIPYTNAGTTQFNILAGTATANQVLLSGSFATPVWSTAVYPATTTINQILYSSAANNITGLATANSAQLVTNSSGVPAWTASMTNGQVIIGNTGATPTPATLTAGSNINITNGAGTITIASTGFASFSFNDVTTSTQAMAVNSGYIADYSGGTCVMTLPSTAAQGTVITVVGGASAGSSTSWKIAQNAGQIIHLEPFTTTTGTSGFIQANSQYCAITLVCIVANTTFMAVSSMGSITVN